jgi:hypothetical protein
LPSLPTSTSRTTTAELNISVQAERDETETARSAALTAHQTAKKIDELVDRNKFEELDVLKLKLTTTTPNTYTTVTTKDKREVSNKNAVEFNINKQL